MRCSLLVVIFQNKAGWWVRVDRGLSPMYYGTLWYPTSLRTSTEDPSYP